MSWYANGKKINYVYADGGFGNFVVLNRFGQPTGQTADGNLANEEEIRNALADDSPIDPNTRQIAQWRDDEEGGMGF